MCDKIPKCSTIRVLIIILGMFYIQILDFGTMYELKHIIYHICSSCGIIGEGVRIERGDMKLRRGYDLLFCTRLMPFVMNSEVLNY